MSGETPRITVYGSECAVVAVITKTWLEVPDDRLCNAKLLRELFDSDNVQLLPARAKCD